MALAAFDLNDRSGFAAVVFARNRDQANRLARAHRASFRNALISEIILMERSPPIGGSGREHHIAAIEAGIAGIGHQQVDGTWLILPPGVRPLHVAPPNPTKMFHFNDDDGYEVVLFAHNRARAAQLYAAILPNYRVLPREWRGSEMEAWCAYGLVRHKGQAEARGVEGVGIYSPDGWLILPLDYDALGVKPPD